MEDMRREIDSVRAENNRIKNELNTLKSFNIEREQKLIEQIRSKESLKDQLVTLELVLKAKDKDIHLRSEELEEAQKEKSKLIEVLEEEVMLSDALSKNLAMSNMEASPFYSALEEVDKKVGENLKESDKSRTLSKDIKDDETDLLSSRGQDDVQRVMSLKKRLVDLRDVANRQIDDPKITQSQNKRLVSMRDFLDKKILEIDPINDDVNILFEDVKRSMRDILEAGPKKRINLKEKL